MATYIISIFLCTHILLSWADFITLKSLVLPFPLPCPLNMMFTINFIIMHDGIFKIALIFVVFMGFILTFKIQEVEMAVGH